MDEQEPREGDQDAWKPVILGQVSGNLVPPHPGAPESPEDELTRAALEDPLDVNDQEPDPHPTFWRVLVVVLIAVGALSVVFRLAR
jgi:hypothetical protein